MRMHIRTINYGVLLTLGYALLFMHFCLRTFVYTIWLMQAVLHLVLVIAK